jgi:WD40 repeat protein
VAGREVIVSGSNDDTVRVWDAGTGQPLGKPIGHASSVNAVALGSVSGREVIVSGSGDRTVRVWDAGSGQPLGEPLTGNTDLVMAVALGSVAGREVIVSGSNDDTVRIWGYMNSTDITVDLLASVEALGLTNPGILCVATDRALSAFAIPTSPVLSP